MKKFILTKIQNREYSHIITFLTYEVNVDTQLLKIKPLCDASVKSVLVDLALVSGLGEFRFVKYALDEEGKIVLSSQMFVSPPLSIVNLANTILAKNRVAVAVSFLSRSQQDYILNASHNGNNHI